MLEIKNLTVAIDVFKNESQWLVSWLPTFFKISCVQQKKLYGYETNSEQKKKL